MTAIGIGIAFVGIALGLMGCVIAMATYRYSSKKLAAETAAAEREAGAVDPAEFEALKRRVAVLERLATSEDARVAREIDRLGKDDLSPHA